VASVFQLLAVHWHDHVLEPGDLRQHLTQHWIHQASVFHLPEAPRLRQALGCSPRQWSVASGASFLAGFPAKLLLAPHLRYCPECLAAGWHCAMFQHIAARWCPLHRTPLRQGCPRCDKPINIEPVSIATHQNFCPHCSALFAPMDALRARRETGPGEHAVVGRLAAALRPEPTADLACFRSDLTAHELLATDRTTLVACAAHSSWPAGLTPGVRWFPATTSVVATTEPLPIERVNELAYAARVAAFENIQDCLQASGKTLEVPPVLHLMETTRGAARISTPMDTCSAALARTAVALQMQEVLPGARPASGRTSDRPSPYNQWLPMYEQLVHRVAESQVYGLYVLNLVELRRCRQTLDVAWNWRAHPATFSPPWRLRRHGGEVVFEMRARVDAQSLRRLVRRYAGRRLHSFIQSASCSACESPASPLPIVPDKSRRAAVRPLAGR
jgi:hypothetical protein